MLTITLVGYLAVATIIGGLLLLGIREVWPVYLSLSDPGKYAEVDVLRVVLFVGYLTVATMLLIHVDWPHIAIVITP